MNKLNEKIKKSLSGKKIKPKWQFISLNLLKDIGLVALLIIAILALGIITYTITQNNPWEFLPSGFKFFLRGFPALPLELIGLLALIIVAIYFLIKKVHFIYRLNNIIIISGIILITLGGYFIADATGINEKVFNSAPIRRLHKNQGRFFFPHRGPKIIGEIKDIQDNNIIIEDNKGKEWRINYSEETKIPQKENLSTGDNIMVVGEKNDSNINAYGIKETQNILPPKQRIRGEKSPDSGTSSGTDSAGASRTKK